MRIPSLKMLQSRGFSTVDAKSVRTILAKYRAAKNENWNRPSIRRRDALEEISTIIGGFGVESIPEGHNQKSPAIQYVNMGDAYATTILYVNGNFSVGDWGTIVERGSYD